MILKIGNRGINPDQITDIDDNAAEEEWRNNLADAPHGIAVYLTAIDGSFGTISGNTGEWGSRRLWFGGAEADALRRWLDANSTDLMGEGAPGRALTADEHAAVIDVLGEIVTLSGNAERLLNEWNGDNADVVDQALGYVGDVIAIARQALGR
jgi:hypothetical protein